MSSIVKHLKMYDYVPAFAVRSLPDGALARLWAVCIGYIRFQFGEGFLWSVKSLMLGTTLIAYYLLTPADVDYSLLRASDYLALWVRNMGLMLICCGALHGYFHTFKCQGAHLQYMDKNLGKGSRFWFGDQVWDNIFWTMGSGVAIWTLNEGAYLYLYDAGYLMRVEFGESVFGTAWFLILFLLLGPLRAVHFYIIHYFLHWAPMYKSVHILHHRNIVLNPWAGLSMHPVEHLLYLCPWIAFFVVPSHPLHVIFLMHYLTMGAAFTHTGFERLKLWGGVSFPISGFYHQVHHTHYDCNYGIPDLNVDRVFGTWDVGEELREKRVV